MSLVPLSNFNTCAETFGICDEFSFHHIPPTDEILLSRNVKLSEVYPNLQVDVDGIELFAEDLQKLNPKNKSKEVEISANPPSSQKRKLVQTVLFSSKCSVNTTTTASSKQLKKPKINRETSFTPSSSTTLPCFFESSTPPAPVPHVLPEIPVSLPVMNQPPTIPNKTSTKQSASAKKQHQPFATKTPKHNEMSPLHFRPGEFCHYFWHSPEEESVENHWLDPFEDSSFYMLSNAIANHVYKKQEQQQQ